MESDQEVVYFVAIRTSEPKGTEVAAALKVLNEAGLLPAEAADYAVAWARPYSEMTANDHGHLRALGLDFPEANRIATVAWVDE